jgi:hypothetical protein
MYELVRAHNRRRSVYMHEFAWDNIVAIAYTALIAAELVNVAFEVRLARAYASPPPHV